MRKIKLSEVIVSADKFIKDNRALGLLANVVLAQELGGKALGGGNKQLQWVSEDGVTYALGSGKIPETFIKSKNKGSGRSGCELKEGDAFLHISLVDGECVIVTYTREQIEEMV